MPKDPNAASSSAIRPKRPVRPLTSTDLVLTPGGLRPRELVHELKDGEHVSVEGGRVRIIESATGNVIKDMGETATLDEDEARAQSTVAAPIPALPDIGWIEDSQWHNTGSDPIVYFSTDWVVPPAPSSSDSQTVFLFNGLQPDNGAHILQPVLQWGPSAAGGGNYWSITNWYADGQNGPAVYKAPIQVAVGTLLRGFMTCTGQSTAGYNYTSSFANHTTVDVTVTGVPELTWAYETLECYGSNPNLPVPKCSDYPATSHTSMFNIEIRTGTPGATGSEATLSWYAATNFSDCSQSCRIASNASPGGQVDLFYSSAWQLVDNNPACTAIFAETTNLYQLHNDGTIWRYTGVPLTGWQELDNNPACAQIAAGAGILYERHNTGLIWKYIGPPITGWQELDNNPASIDIAVDNGYLYQRHGTGLIWKYTGTPFTGWQELDNNPATIAIAAAGDGAFLYQLHNDGSIWKYTGTPLTGWQELDNNPAAIAIAASAGNLYQLHKDGSIWQYTGVPLTGWQQLDVNPAAIAIVADGNLLYQLHNDGSIWKYVTPAITGWQLLDSNPATTSIVAADGLLYQRHNDGTIWKYLA